MKLNAKALGLTCGLIWGIMVMIVTLVCLWTNGSYGRNFLSVLSSVYPGFSINAGGIILGLVYGFIDGFIGGWLIGKIYNFFVK